MKLRSSTATVKTTVPTPASKSVCDRVINLDGDVNFLDQYSLKKADGQGNFSRFCSVSISICKGLSALALQSRSNRDRI